MAEAVDRRAWSRAAMLAEVIANSSFFRDEGQAWHAWQFNPYEIRERPPQKRNRPPRVSVDALKVFVGQGPPPAVATAQAQARRNRNLTEKKQ